MTNDRDTPQPFEAVAAPPVIDTQASAAAVDVAAVDAAAVDVAAALNRIGGNVALYAKLLRRFADMYAARTAIRELVARGQRSEARDAVHTIRGAAATLGILSIVPTARALEAALAGEETLPEGLLDAYEALLDGSLQAARDAAARLVR